MTDGKENYEFDLGVKGLNKTLLEVRRSSQLRTLLKLVVVGRT